MGRLTQGAPLSKEEIKGKVAEDIRNRGLMEFLNCWNLYKDDVDRLPSWGDELEHTLIKFDHEKKTVKLHLRAHDLLTGPLSQSTHGCWQPEFTRYQVESIPSKPYDGTLQGILQVAPSLRRRSKTLFELRNDTDTTVNMSTFPRLCCPGFTDPECHSSDENDLSPMFPIGVLSPKPRCIDTARNTLPYGGNGKQKFDLPVFQDQNPLDPTMNTKKESIHFDTYCPAGGVSALQVTFQSSCLDEARYMYDQFAVLTPLLISLTASSPCMCGYLTEFDHRIAMQMGVSADSVSHKIINGVGGMRNRFGSIGCFTSRLGQSYNDLPVPKFEIGARTLENNGVDTALVQHIAHIFYRDIIYAPRDYKTEECACPTEYFDIIQSTYWQTVRLKLPDARNDIGWRVEVRPLEINLTDFENTSFIVFVWLIFRTILWFGLDFYIPISKLDQNVDKSARRDAVNCETIHFRWNCHKPELLREGWPDRSDINELSTHEIINGSAEQQFPGLVPLVKLYLDQQDNDKNVVDEVDKYLQHCSDVASGAKPTRATWIRQFIRQHPKYQFDSQVTEEIQYDLMRKMGEIMSADFQK